MHPDLDIVIPARPKDLGGFEVRRALPFAKRRMVGPFIFLDHIGPAEMPPGQAVDVRAHPHINLATVTYLFEGALLHRDTLGTELVIRPGDVNWMTAGRGIAHSERTPSPERETGHRLHGIQFWVALPIEHEETAPEFFHHPAATLPTFTEQNVPIRLLAGAAYGRTSPVKTYSPMFYFEAELAAGQSLSFLPEAQECGVYIAAGDLVAGEDSYAVGDLLVYRPHATVQVRSTGGARIIVFGGAALPGERKIWWNFVSSRPERIEAAKADWEAGRFGLPPNESERIPLPPQ